MPDIFTTLEDIDSKVVLDYTSRDFTAIRAQLVGLAQGFMPEWETVGEAGDFGTLVLELFAYMGDVLHFYIDRTASEAFLGTALRRQSVLYIADMLGYTPIGQQAAIVTLKFSLDPNHAEDLVAAATAAGTSPVPPLVIPAGTVIRSEADNSDDVVSFELNSPVSLDPTDTPLYTDIVGYATEGTTVDSLLIGTGSGSPNTELVLPHKGVIYGSVSVRTIEGAQSIEWSYTSDISLARPTQAMFTTFLDDVSNTHLVFGDNASGRIPPVNAKIHTTYRYGVGAKANSLASATLVTIEPPPNVDWWGVSVTNEASPLGGADPESADAMRQSIPRAAGRIKQRAITLNDYADLALQVPGVAKSVAHGTVYTAVHVKIAPQRGQANTTYMQLLCNQVEDYMADKVIVGSTVYAEPDDPEELWHNVWIRVTVHVQDGFNRSSVRRGVDGVVRQVIDFDNVDFGTRISVGTIYRAVLSIQGVEWADLEWLATSEPVDPDVTDDTTQIASVVYRHDSSNTISDPGTGGYRRNDNVNPTVFAVSATGEQGSVPNWSLIHVGDHMVYRPMADVHSWMSFVITAVPVNNTTWWQVNVAPVDKAETVTPPGNNTDVLFTVLRYAPSPDSLSPVQDIVTPPLFIPRIEPTEIIETEVDYPNLGEDERTHDGLWVLAEGGVTGT